MIFPITAFKDNYIWMLVDEESKEAWIVDPGDAQPVVVKLREKGLQLKGILLTHHHWDHAGGVLDLLHEWEGIPVYGAVKNVVTYPVQEGDTIQCGSVLFHVLEIPGHTLDHVAFYNQDALFCGDTLFSVGCGKVFEGTPAQMYQSLNTLAQLPDNVKIYCGHEYTLANLYFAQQVEPNNQAILEKIGQVKKLREQGKPTLPSTIAEEKKINPFLRCQESSVIHAVEQHFNRHFDSPVDIFAHLREWKNGFRVDW